jgi:hypothetical protein
MSPLFDHIRELSSESSSENRWELFFQRQQALMEVTSASLEVDAATGQMDVEIAETRELQNYLTAHRDSQVGRLNLVSIAIGGTAGTASSALGLTTHARAASVTGIVAGSATAVLSLIGLRISEGPKRELEVKSNMLSELFDRPANDRKCLFKGRGYIHELTRARRFGGSDAAAAADPRLGAGGPDSRAGFSEGAREDCPNYEHARREDQTDHW